jgi:hypothetical protein
MDRRRFLVIASTASVALAATARATAVFAAPERIASVALVRGQRRLLLGAPGGCAASRCSTAIATYLREVLAR